MSGTPKFCSKCGRSLTESSSFCPNCGASLNPSLKAKVADSPGSNNIFKRYWRKSVKGRIFYGAWVLINISNGSNLLVSASAPKDRFRSVCNWEGVNCPPSAEQQALQSLFNLVLWNIFFWAFRYFYRKKQLKKKSL